LPYLSFQKQTHDCVGKIKVFDVLGINNTCGQKVLELAGLVSINSVGSNGSELFYKCIVGLDHNIVPKFGAYRNIKGIFDGVIFDNLIYAIKVTVFKVKNVKETKLNQNLGVSFCDNLQSVVFHSDSLNIKRNRKFGFHPKFKYAVIPVAFYIFITKEIASSRQPITTLGSLICIGESPVILLM
jgi:hypothetical protein